jgi:hypothetical protein
MRRLIVVLAVMLSCAAPSAASVITFDTAPLGTFGGPVTENGFVYYNGFGNFAVAGLGRSGQDLEARVSGGIVVVQRDGGGLFTFDSIDFAAFDSMGISDGSLIVGGVRNGAFLSFPTFTLPGTAVTTPTYANWKTEYASSLRNVPIDTLLIVMGAGFEPGVNYTAIDNLKVSPYVPEPASLALFAAALAGVFARRRKSASATIEG